MDFLTDTCHRKTFERGSGPLPKKEKHGRSLREDVAAVAGCPPRASVCLASRRYARVAEGSEATRRW
jgi:hypothetical protein